MTRPKVVRIGKPVPEELILLRRFAALPIGYRFIAAATLVTCGHSSPDEAYRDTYRSRRSAAAIKREAAKAEARMMARAAAGGPP